MPSHPNHQTRRKQRPRLILTATTASQKLNIAGCAGTPMPGVGAAAIAVAWMHEEHDPISNVLPACFSQQARLLHFLDASARSDPGGPAAGSATTRPRVGTRGGAAPATLLDDNSCRNERRHAASHGGQRVLEEVATRCGRWRSTVCLMRRHTAVALGRLSDRLSHSPRWYRDPAFGIPIRQRRIHPGLPSRAG